MHREIRRPESAQGGAPSVETDSSQHDLQHRRIERVERRSLIRVQTGGEGGGIEHDVEGPPGEEGAQGRERRVILETGHEDADDSKALVAKRASQRFYRTEIVGEIDGAIEDDKGGRRALPSVKTRSVEAAEGPDRDGRWSARHGADLGGKKRKARHHIVGAALVEIAPDLQHRVWIERRGLVQACVAAPIPRQQRQFEAAATRQRPEFIHAVAPIIRPAKHAHGHQLGARAHPFQIEVDRERMAQCRERSDP